MPTTNIQVQAGANTYNNTRTVSVDDLQRLANALRAYHGDPAMTDEQAVEAWARLLYRKTIEFIREIESRQLTDITLT